MMMKAVIFAGGKGERLWPLTDVKPKPLLPVANCPMLERVMDNINKVLGISEFIIITNYKSDCIEEYCNGSKFKIETVKEKRFLGTAGGLRLIKDRLDGDFVVWNSDTFAFFDGKELLRFHRKNKAKATVCITKNEVRSHFGETRTGSDSRLLEFVEKPIFRHHVNIGVYVLKPEVISFIKEGESLGMDVLLKRALHGVFCYDINGMWVDVGNFSTFVYANTLFLKEYDLHGNLSKGKGFRLKDNYLIAEEVKIGRGCEISNTSIGRGARIGENTTIESSVVFPGVTIGSRCNIKNSVIGYNAKIEDGTSMDQSITTRI
ncbi:MAG: NDP-sugar synthase [Candidatus Aenigmatarchaeota archaeon]